MKPVTLDHFAEYQFPSMLRSNGHGKVSFLTKQANLKENSYDTNLWILEDTGARQLTFSNDIQGAFWKDPDTLLFIRAQKAKDKQAIANGLPLTIFQSLSMTNSGEASEFLRLPYSVYDLAFLPDGRFLFLAEYDPNIEHILQETGKDSDKASELIKEDAVCQVLTTLPFWENGSGFTGEKRQRLYLYDGENCVPLVDELTSVLSFCLSPDFSTVFYVSQRYEERIPVDDRLYQLELTTYKKKDISVEPYFSHTHCIPLSNECLIVFGSNMHHFGINQNGSFYRLDLAKETTTVLYDQHEYDGWDAIGSDLKMPSAPKWFAYEDKLYWIAQKGESSQIFSIHTDTGEISPVSSRNGCISELVFAGSEIVYTAMRELNGPELYRISLDTLIEKPSTSFNHFSTTFSFSTPNPIHFTNQEGNLIHGWVMQPTEYQEGKTYPALLVIHGGPKTSYNAVLMHEMQYWANQGYGVFFCNPTGSSGQGDDFGDLRERYGLIDFDDLMFFTDLVLEQNEWIDSTRLGVTGGSYGGFMTNWIIGNTNRFKAAVSERSIANWSTMQTLSDIGYFFVPDQTGTSMWNGPESIWDQSPIKYAMNVKTPTLFVHSDKDFRCPLSEGLQMYSALQHFGVETKFCLFKDENHDLTRTGSPLSRKRRLDEITRWFNQYLSV